ncbi:Hypothetical predicted protein [Paramuricea clavata]|uniref:Uncharacterized protein n=1 Tax=Paramuricea clavata TaxID=317549 RepID=A0A6S7HVK0_PARCT|nr:Hypothetical predicted protein [Paramuricea clavata]
MADVTWALAILAGHQEHNFLAFVKQVERSNYNIFIYFLPLLLALSSTKCSHICCHCK